MAIRRSLQFRGIDPPSCILNPYFSFDRRRGRLAQELKVSFPSWLLTKGFSVKIKIMKDNRQMLLTVSPSIVKEFPEPFLPYAKIQTLYIVAVRTTLGKLRDFLEYFRLSGPWLKYLARRQPE